MQNTTINEKCPICGKALIAKSENTDYDATFYNCKYCKKFMLEDEFEREYLKTISSVDLTKLINLLYTSSENSKYRREPICEENLQELLSLTNCPKTLIDKIDNTLTYFVEKTDHFGQKIEVNPKTLYRELFCINIKELGEILRTLKRSGYLSSDDTVECSAKFKVWVEIAGLKYYDENLRHRTRLNQCFVAMWFNEEADIENYKPNMTEVYANAIKPAIENENRFNAVRIDCIEYCNDINDEMIAQIRKSRFMVADLTGYRGGVYWEAGFAYGLGMPVIYTCHEEWLKSNEDLNIEGVHFDLSHRNIILWDNTEEGLKKLQDDLKNRIEAIIV